jgi:class 3 adenylate cyclase/predicted ATPase
LGPRKRLLKAIATLAAEQKLAVSSGPPRVRPDVAERRQVTVMFSDLVGSTALSARMDPEDLREVISAYQKCVAEAVQRFGGFVANYMGDGVLVYFGYPEAHEDDAERAVRAGLELIAAVTALKTSVSLQTRVGIATGLVVVGDLIGSGKALESGIVGETPNLAARLQAVAVPNTVIIAESTRKLLGNLFELEDIGAKDLKGITGSVRAWAALRAASVESRFEALHAGGVTELVGREEELNLLLRRWSKAKTGDGQVVLLSGEAGIGKSRLTAALFEAISPEPHSRLRHSCSPHRTDSALYAQSSTSAHDATLFADLLSLPNDGRYPELELSPQQRRQRTLDALVSQVAALSRQNPLLIIFEDAHWTDPTGLELFSRIIDKIPTLRVLLLITFRPEFEASWVGQPHVTALTINRMTRHEVDAMIERSVDSRPLSADIRQNIIERSDGIPLFVEEMTKAALEAEGEREARQTIAPVPLSVPVVPASLHASLMARLDRLGSAKEVAQVGATLGREFSHAQLAAVVRKPEAELQSALDRIVAAGLLFKQGAPPNAAYLFKHALVLDAAYSTLLRSRRQQLHSRIVTAIEGQFPEIVEAQPEVLARHCAEAGSVEKAVGYWLKAGQQAIARWAMAEGVAQLRKGLDLLSGMPDDAARLEREIDLQVKLGQALSATKGYAAPEAGEAFARAHELCELLSWPPRLEVLTGQFVFRLGRGELQQAEHYAQGLCRLGEARNDPRWNAAGLASTAFISFLQGRFTDARVYYENAIGLWDSLYRPSVVSPDDPHVASLIILSRTLLCLGYVDQARLRRDEALAEARRISPYNRIYALCDAWPGDWAIEGAKEARTMLQSAEQALANSRDQSFPMFSGLGHIMRGWCLSAIGQAAEGLPLLLQGVAIRRAAGSNLLLAFYLTTLAEAYGMAAQLEEGLNWLAEAAKIMETTNDCWAEAEMHRMRGTLLLSLRERAAAEKSYRQALEVARRQSAKFWELRAAMSLARLWRDQDKPQQARELLAPVYGWFTEGFDTRDLKEAKALLEELAA